MKANEKYMSDSPMTNRPLVTFALFAYNQEKYIGEAIKGALSQTYTPLEIIISDDCSSDNTWEVVKREVANYTGPHRLVLNKNKINLGIGAHVNYVTRLAQGELIVAAAGDDISLPERVERIFHAYESAGEKFAYIYSNLTAIDEHGCKQQFSLPVIKTEYLTAQWIACGIHGAYGASSAWTKSLFTQFGQLAENVIHEDAVLPFRAALAGKLLFVDEPLMLYRRHGSNTWKSNEDLQTAADLISNIQRHAEGNLQIMVSKIDDFQKYISASGGDNIRDEEIKVTLLTYRKIYSFELLLINSTSKIKRLGILANAFLNGVGAKQLIKWLLIFYTPSLYIKVQRRKHRKPLGSNT